MPGEAERKRPARSPGGSEQFMHSIGELVVRGERFAVDCRAARDRSWRQVRTERQGAVKSPPVGWSPMYFGEDLVFNQISFERSTPTPHGEASTMFPRIARLTTSRGSTEAASRARSPECAAACSSVTPSFTPRHGKKSRPRTRPAKFIASRDRRSPWRPCGVAERVVPRQRVPLGERRWSRRALHVPGDLVRRLPAQDEVEEDGLRDGARQQDDPEVAERKLTSWLAGKLDGRAGRARFGPRHPARQRHVERNHPLRRFLARRVRSGAARKIRGTRRAERRERVPRENAARPSTG